MELNENKIGIKELTRRKSLTLLMVFAVVSSFSLSFVFLSGFFIFAKKQIQESIAYESRLLDARLNSIFSSVDFVAKSNSTLSLFLSKELPESSFNAIGNSLNLYKEIKHVYLANGSGDIIYQSNAENPPDRVNMLTKKAIEDQVGFVSANTEEILIFEPVRYYGAIGGLVIVRIDNQALVNEVSTSKNYITSIVTEKSQAKSDIHFLTLDAFHDLTIANKNTIDAGVKLHITDTSGKLKKVALIIFVLFCLVIFLSALFAIQFSDILSNSITTPITELTKRVTNKAKCTPIKGPREINALAASFDETQSELEGINRMLEVKVIKRTKEYKEAKDKAELALKVRAEFLANMSHEIRTPLNGIMGIIQSLHDRNLDSETKDSVQIIYDSGKQLLTIVDDVLTVSKLNSANYTVVKEEVNLETIANRLIGLGRPMAEEKGLILKLKLDINHRYTLISDSVRLSQLLQNLIMNSIKFTEKGHVNLEITTQEQDSQNVFIEFKITDTGIGFDEKQKSTIFEAFNQADTSITRKYGGTGLGLTICTKICSLLNLKIDVTSAPQKGTSFTIVGLFKQEKVSQHSESSNHAVQLPDSTISILAADDNAINQKVVRALLKNDQVNIITAENGQAAIEILDSNPTIDLVLMDMQMPVLDGVSATKKIRANKKYNSIPIIALTANSFEEHKQACFDAGMDGYVSKPFTRTNLVKEVNRCLKDKRPDLFQLAS